MGRVWPLSPPKAHGFTTTHILAKKASHLPIDHVNVTRNPRGVCYGRMAVIQKKSKHVYHRILVIVGLLAALGCRESPTKTSPDTALEATRTKTLKQAPGKSASKAPSKSGTPLRLATWNIYWLGSPAASGRAPRTLKDIERLREYVLRLKADVLSLQEIDGVEAVRLLFGEDAWDAACTRAGGVQNVCMVVRKRSGWRIERTAPYEALNTTGRLRAGLEVTLGHPDVKTPVKVLGVHLKSGCFQDGPDSGREACPKLFAQIPRLEAWIDARAKARDAFVVLGDFNRRLAKPGDVVWKDLEDGEPSGLKLVRSIKTGRAPCWSGRYPDYIDHIVLGGRATGWLTNSAQLVFEETDYKASYKRISDHCPLWADLLVR